MTGNAYVGYNSGAGDYIDIDHPNNKPTGNLSTGRWQFVVLTITSSAIRLYVDGNAKTFKNIAGTMGGKNITSFYGNDYSQLLALLTQCTTFCLGNGSFWGSPEASFDDVILYNRALEQYEVKQLTAMASRVYDFHSQSPDDITTLIAPFTMQGCNDTYDLQGRRVISGKRGLYIRNGKKVFVK
jgi:arabinan endo-1,5-alpha-L-arabinosidase